jgi:hypothetical protein|tara:strand:+ start:861 stop:1037 length:177 start_codon:yes stop_codon:yes gene_type:complete
MRHTIELEFRIEELDDEVKLKVSRLVNSLASHQFNAKLFDKAMNRLGVVQDTLDKGVR